MPWRVRIATHNDCAPMIVYLATKAEFRADILSNRIEEIVHDSFKGVLGKSVCSGSSAANSLGTLNKKGAQASCLFLKDEKATGKMPMLHSPAFNVFFLDGDQLIHWKNIGEKSQIRERAESLGATVTEMALVSHSVKYNNPARHSLGFPPKSLNRMPAKHKASSQKCSASNLGYLFNGESELSLIA